MKRNVSLSVLPAERLRLDEGPFAPLDEETFSALKESIRRYGLIYPLVVAKDHSGNDYVVLDGRNRYRALVALGVKEIPCYIMDVDFPEGYVIAYETELFRRHLDFREVERAIEEKSRIERELVMEYRRRILENLAEFMTDDLRRAISERIRDLSVLIDVYYASEQLARVAPDLKKTLFGTIAERILSRASAEISNESSQLKKEKEEKERKLTELERRLRELEREKRALEDNYRKILEKMEKRIREDLLRRMASEDDRLREAMREYRKVLAEKLVREEMETRKNMQELTKTIDSLKREIEENRETISALREKLKSSLLERERLKRQMQSVRETLSGVFSIEACLAEIDGLMDRLRGVKRFTESVRNREILFGEEDLLLFRRKLGELGEALEDTLSTIRTVIGSGA